MRFQIQMTAIKYPAQRNGAYYILPIDLGKAVDQVPGIKGFLAVMTSIGRRLVLVLVMQFCRQTLKNIIFRFG